MKKTSLKNKLIRLFMITSLIPILFLGIFSYVDISKELKTNINDMASQNLLQTDTNLNITLEAYEDVLYQIYTDDDMVDWVDRIDEGMEESVARNQMRRYIRGILNTKDYIRSISVITKSRTVIVYDQMTPATYQNSWFDNYSVSPDKIYENVSADNNTHIYSTEYGTTFANNDYYLFHIAHRIIDWRKPNRECGVVIISLDGELLDYICRNYEDSEVITNFMVDEQGRLISNVSEKEHIGERITKMSREEDLRLSDYENFLTDIEIFESPIMVNLYHDAGLGWDIVSVTSLDNLIAAQIRQIIIIILLGILVFAVVVFFSTRMSGQLIHSVQSIVHGIKRVSDGDISANIEKDKNMSVEIELIADGFNDMTQKLRLSQENEREANRRQMAAELYALEAQINPHFLYNTLDTINWMAIDKDEYEISNAINALAQNLRYGITNGNELVTVKEETEWLKRYIYLQQHRLQSELTCDLNIDNEVYDIPIHKLLLQPFVENAIVHAFDKDITEPHLFISVSRDGDRLKIVIEDNGCGMDEDTLSKIRTEMSGKIMEGKHIGMENAMTRLRMYYGDTANINVSSIQGSGTRIEISFNYSVNLV